jgi:hypothetical protein
MARDRLFFFFHSRESSSSAAHDPPLSAKRPAIGEEGYTAIRDTVLW